MRKYTSVMGLYVKNTVYRLLAVLLLLFAVFFLVCLLPKETSAVQISFLTFVCTVVYPIAAIILSFSLSGGGSNPENLLLRLRLPVKKMMWIFSAAAFIELCMVWLAEVLLFLAVNTAGTADKQFIAYVTDNPALSKLLFPDPAIIICNLLFLAMVSVGIGLTNIATLRGYEAYRLLGTIIPAYLYANASGEYLIPRLYLLLLLLAASVTWMYLGYRKELKHDKE